MTKSKSLEKFYINFNKQILLTSSFTDKPGLSKIITMCRLKPYDLLFEEYNSKVILHHRWVDEFGNSLYINQNKTIDIELNELSLDHSKLVNTDLYAQLPVEKVSEISKLLFMLNGKEEDALSSHTILAFLGIDNYLRIFVFLYGEWRRYPPLYLGIKMLFHIADNLSLGSFKEINVLERVIYPCDSQRAWISCWPPGEDFVSIMGKQNNSVIALLNLQKGNKNK